MHYLSIIASVKATILIGLIFFITSFFSFSYGQTTFTVTNNNTTGPGSLDQAIIDSNNNPGADIITFDNAYTIEVDGSSLANALTEIEGDLTIDGDIDNDGNADITLTDIDNSNIVQVLFISGTSLNVTIEGLIFNNISSDDDGTAIGLSSAAGITLNIALCEFRNLTNNDDSGSNGGAIAAASQNTVIIDRSIFQNVSQSGSGAVIGMNVDSDITVSNSLFFENNVGLGIVDAFGSSATIVLRNVTSADNTGDIVSTGGGASANVYNSIYDSGSTISGSNNLVESSSLFKNSANDDYTLASGASGAIDQGSDAQASGSFDLVGNPRIEGSAVDIGAYEFTATTPSVTTTIVSTFDANSATLGGEVTDDGGATVTERGIVWNTIGSPNVNDNRVDIGSGTGTFSQSVGLLPFGTQIHVRAFAINTEGTAYGSEQTFTTSNSVSASLDGAEGWRLLSIPANVQLSTFLGPIWTQGVTSGGDTDFGTPNVYTWDLGSPDDDVNDWNDVTDLNTTLPAGIGFLALVYEDPDYDGPTSAGFPQTLNLSGSELASGTSPSLNSTATGWTLLGNPFGTPIDADLLTKNNLANTIYMWDPNEGGGDGGQPVNQTTGSWKTYNGSNGDVTGGRIAPFQGFFVQNASSSSSVTFEQNDKTTTATTFLGKEKEIPFVRLELQGQGMRNSAWMEFTSGGSTEKTNGDAWELTPLSTNYALLATQKADGSLVDIGRYPQESKLEIPLVTEATQPGSYVLNVTDFEAPGQTLYLNDLQAGESLRLEQDTRYEFIIEQAAKVPVDPFSILQNGLKKQASENHRFVISSSALENPVETPDTFALQQNYPNPFNPVTVIRYQLPVGSDVRLEVFDISGRQVATLVEASQPSGTYSVSFDASDLSSGVYLYRMQASGAVFTKKLTLIK